MKLEFISTSEGAKVIGALTRDTVPSIKWSASNSVAVVSLDLAQLSHADSAGLAWLIHTVGKLRHNSQQLQLCNVPEQLTRLIELGKVEPLFLQ